MNAIIQSRWNGESTNYALVNLRRCSLRRAVQCALALAIMGFFMLAGQAKEYRLRFAVPVEMTGDSELRLQLFADESLTERVGNAVLLSQAPVKNQQVEAAVDFGIPLVRKGTYPIKIEARKPGQDAAFATLAGRHELSVSSSGELKVTARGFRMGKSPSDLFLYIIGFLCVLFYATDRFNSPSSNKSTTTKIRYYGACGAYCCIGLTAYTLLIYSPDLITRGADPSVLPEWTKGLAPPLVVALALTIFLPKLPILSGMDEWLRKKLQVIAAIPSEARRLSKLLQKSEFSVREERQREIRKDLESKGIEAADVVFENDGSLQAKLTRIAALLAQIRESQSEHRFSAFITTFGQEFGRLENLYDTLLKQSRRCYCFMRERPDNDTQMLNKITFDLKEDCLNLADKLWEDLLLYVSRAILDGRFMHKSRMERARELGFALPAPRDERCQLTFNELFLIFGVILTGLLVMFCGFEMTAAKTPPAEAILKALMISIIYCVAVFFALFPKSWWKFGQCARPCPLRKRPWAFYFTVGAISAVVSLMVSALFRLVLSMGDWNAVGRGLVEKYPYCLVTFAMAFLISMAADNTVTKRLNRHWLRGIEALTIGGTGVALAFFVHNLLTSTVSNAAAMPPLAALIGTFGVMGLFLGSCVPTWYREAAPADLPAEGSTQMIRATDQRPELSFDLAGSI
jgi:hypothetical protein